MIRVRSVTKVSAAQAGQQSGRSRWLATLAIFVVLSSWTVVPVASATPTTPPVSPAATTAPAQESVPGSDVDPALTQAQVQAQVAEAELVRAQLIASDVRLVAKSEHLRELSAEAAVLLEQVRVAREQQTRANALMSTHLRRLTALQGEVDTSAADLGRWAREAYTTGGPMASYEGWITGLEGRNTGDVGHDLAVLQRVGVLGSFTLDRLEVATSAQKDAANRAGGAAVSAVAARTRADAAKKQVDLVLTSQRQALAELQVEQLRILADAQAARAKLLTGGSAPALVAEARLAATVRARPIAVSVDLEPGECTGLDISSYPNGQIPPAALCSVWAAPGALLRADAASAFRRLSLEYTLAFGAPICLTDSYRTRAGQVAVFAAKPTLAAIPGTSNHGWGTALDLCGGIQSFGTPQHAWMLVHAPMYGWFHPGWAGPTGSRPEPWHWEFAG